MDTVMIIELRSGRLSLDFPLVFYEPTPYFDEKLEDIKGIADLLDKHANAPFAFLELRTAPMSTDPSALLSITIPHHFRAYAMVSDIPSIRSVFTEFEKHYLEESGIPYVTTFEDLNKAINWCKEKLSA